MYRCITLGFHIKLTFKDVFYSTKMSDQTALLNSLRITLVEFLDELIDTFPQEGDFVIFRIFIKDRIPPEFIMKYIVEKLCPLEEMVKKRDEGFFLNNNILFGFDGNDNTLNKVNHFKRLWQSNSMDAENKDIIWSWFKTFIALGNKYKNLQNK